MLAAGKAAGAMSEAAEAHYLDGRRLQSAKLSGLAVTRRGYGRPTRAVRIVEAGHPVPDEAGLTATLEKEKIGCIVFSPLAQGLLTNKYLNGIPEDSRAAKHTSLDPDSITHDKVDKVKKLNDIAKARRQSLAQMAVAWTLRDKVVTSSLIGASKVAHVEEAVAALNNTTFSASEQSAIESALK